MRAMVLSRTVALDSCPGPSRKPARCSVPEDYAFRLPEVFSDEQAAPLLCAGAIGDRSP